MPWTVRATAQRCCDALVSVAGALKMVWPILSALTLTPTLTLTLKMVPVPNLEISP